VTGGDDGELAAFSSAREDAFDHMRRERGPVLPPGLEGASALRGAQLGRPGSDDRVISLILVVLLSRPVLRFINDNDI